MYGILREKGEKLNEKSRMSTERVAYLGIQIQLGKVKAALGI